MNKKIKIIDLVNRIESGEEIPEKIKYNEMEFKYDKSSGKYTRKNSSIITWFCIERFTNDFLNKTVEILEDNTEEIEELNAYKLMESPYMANLLKEQRYDKFMELLKQSEVEIADKLIKLTWVVKEMRKEITNVNKNNIH